MITPDEEWWANARASRDKLASQLSGNANVSLLDIGTDPSGTSKTPVLRVHVRQGDATGLGIPDAIDGIPVRVIRGDYTLQ